jgi:hypothetical protein
VIFSLVYKNVVFREYWEEEELLYMCVDQELGIDASDANFLKYKCKNDDPRGLELGRYTTPDVGANETWPACQTRTTTVKTRESKTNEFYSPARLLKISSKFSIFR